MSVPYGMCYPIVQCGVEIPNRVFVGGLPYSVSGTALHACHCSYMSVSHDSATQCTHCRATHADPRVWVDARARMPTMNAADTWTVHKRQFCLYVTLIRYRMGVGCRMGIRYRMGVCYRKGVRYRMGVGYRMGLGYRMGVGYRMGLGYRMGVSYRMGIGYRMGVC